MKSIFIVLFVLSYTLSFSQTIVLNPQSGKKAPINIKKGDIIYVVVRDTLNLGPGDFKIKNRAYRGRITEIDNGD